MSVRSFTVFQDTTTEIQKINHTSDANVVITTDTDATATLLSTLAAIEKENLHPVTGERAALASSNASKKRKTAVLVTKVLAPLPSSKKQKDLKSESKKSRKSSTGNGKKADDGRKKGARGSRSTRKASPLPRVDEEQEALTATPTQRHPTRLTIPQSKIDSRCYELTVSPLADVSEAYDTATETSDQESIFDKEQSTEPEIRDYFSPVLSHASLPSEQTNVTPLAPKAPNTEFSTPERKRIYSAFTFSSPSPSSERFREAQYPTCETDASHSE
ncbi:hypothetical protein K503DRAFT_710579 [Rhizopogon vinicolor AM-OR11-026]|uniref:Uncharacterized protein n=1 Tax=Rhizopogon vinicolor AM-OR11-026 TaxID=1314800 RepID=A0A1B7NC26_9AGAM|nr:hypothetical protein K503DRAFT_710579 [Rhizopogon vinicolor AM-OR11-026]